MATQFGLRRSRFGPTPRNAGEGNSKNIPEKGSSDAFGQAVAALRAGLQEKSFNRDIFLNQIANYARDFTDADSTVVALHQLGTIVCLARSGAIGPSLGAPVNSRSGISGECLRQGLALRCEDSEKDSRVDSEVCRRLGIRSLAVIPVFDGSEVVGLLEAFSSRPDAFQEKHVVVLERLASLISDSRWREPRDLSPSSQQNTVVSVKAEEQSRALGDFVPSEEQRSTWAEAFNLRPYQIAIVISCLLLDLVTIYWWRR